MFPASCAGSQNEAHMAYVAPKTLTRARTLRRNLTDAETILWSRLRTVSGFKFRRQHPIGPYIADFACVRAQLVIEVDGATHASESERKHDAHREAFMRSRGWHTVRVANADICNGLYGMVDMICEVTAKRIDSFRKS